MSEGRNREEKSDYHLRVVNERGAFHYFYLCNNDDVRGT